MTSELTGPVEVVGTGLLGTSIGLACRRAGLEVLLTDASPEHVRTASGLGAGRPRTPEDRPQLVVVAVPPDHLGSEIVEALRRTDAVVTDVGSIKSEPLQTVGEQLPDELSRYVGSHPMAGSERSGPLAASAALFDGRPWAITPHDEAAPHAVSLVEELARVCGAVPATLDPGEHDRAVARTSHVPHLLAALAATQLAEAQPEHLALSGQGVRDVTRVAAGDPDLYGQIIRANGGAVVELLRDVRDGLSAAIEAIEGAQPDDLVALLSRGVEGTAAIPGKHGGPALPTASVFVQVPDNPGELARLFADVGASETNLEDLRIEHDPGRPVGLVEVVVAANATESLVTALEDRGWRAHR